MDGHGGERSDDLEDGRTRNAEQRESEAKMPQAPGQWATERDIEAAKTRSDGALQASTKDEEQEDRNDGPGCGMERANRRSNVGNKGGESDTHQCSKTVQARAISGTRDAAVR